MHIYARPHASDSGATIEDDRWYATYFRVAMGLGAGKGKLAWVHLGSTDYVGGAAADGGVVLCDQQGKIVELDAKTGGTLGEKDLGEPVKSCVVNVDGLRLAGSPADVKPLAEQLSDVVTSDDPQPVIAQKLLLREAQHRPRTPSRPKALVDLASDPRTSPDLLGERGRPEEPAQRGVVHWRALAKHYDFLKDVLRPPPVGPIAQALGAMKEKGAAPLLAGHLFDPADTDDDVRQAAAALAVVAGPDQLPQLRQFFGMYRASAPNDDIAAAVVSVGQASSCTTSQRSGRRRPTRRPSRMRASGSEAMAALPRRPPGTRRNLHEGRGSARHPFDKLQCGGRRLGMKG